jgi:5'(3')-deoxyribonucleotidase
MKILIDTDGVIRDFVKGIEEQRGLNFDFSTGKSIQVLMGVEDHEFRTRLDNFLFWQHLQPTKDAKEIFEIVKKYFAPENIFIISSSQQTPLAIYGCIKWYKKYTPYFYKNEKIIFCKDKSLFANKGTILIDDYEKTCRQFSQKGGYSILVPRPWNREHRVFAPLNKIETELRMILNKTEVEDA